ncbi:hypothetical protein [Synechococcus sp. ROS8604]|nr:hypothetical protein [Synechococcus sp. ROS8604]QNI88600.1 hypothetical protein SynROS8604_01969 [Synechococcus sp. ROS8604]
MRPIPSPNGSTGPDNPGAQRLALAGLISNSDQPLHEPDPTADG